MVMKQIEGEQQHASYPFFIFLFGKNSTGDVTENLFMHSNLFSLYIMLGM
jgi:hypothetical protein